ncbi:nudix hydrolase 14, chloroplastic-like isoform X2 [Quercus lobata]|uniref:nudix hydrolase 14, chloroplastic-like isoform X2 n=1 Tax=Quercus lobata TaxID=97700 RepID=UPI001243E7A5|nr:nudix hydrolase 14, chloroplastic-like isoform X2 [Quercus lobata]XP_030946784.1 nudix hydrolase 14, chloroplastic-like isoform X2 [Quercus lobata]
MASHILQVSSSMSLHQQLRTLSKTLSLPSHPHRLRSLSSNCKMSTETESSSPLTHSITLPTQLAEPVQIVAAPGISDFQFRTAINSSLFKQWLKNLQTETGILANNAMSLKRVLLQVPGIVFARGPAVAILILLESEGETYAVLTEQVRVPVGRLSLELPAGMLDDDKGDFVGTAAREVEEETGIHLNLEDMIDLTAFLEPSTGCRVFPSPGGCDEEISLFLYRGHVDREIITQLQGKETGLRDHGELIKVRVVSYKNLWRMTADSKVLMAIALYEMAMREGLLLQSKT